MASNNQHQEIHLPRDVLTSDQSSEVSNKFKKQDLGHLTCTLPVKDGGVPTRKRGRLPNALTEEVLERRRLSRLRVNASRPRVEDGDVPARKRGRPPIALTEEVLERRRLSKQRVNASRTEGEGPSRKRGRPRHVRTETILEPRGSSRAEVRGLQPQGRILDRAIEAEEQKHGDFLRLDHVEGYLELSTKTKTYFAIAVALWDADFYVKVDDDFGPISKLYIACIFHSDIVG